MLINRVKRFSKHSRKYLEPFCLIDWSIIDAMLFFETSTQLGMMTDDAVRLVCVHIIFGRNL